MKKFRILSGMTAAAIAMSMMSIAAFAEGETTEEAKPAFTGSATLEGTGWWKQTPAISIAELIGDNDLADVDHIDFTANATFMLGYNGIEEYIGDNGEPTYWVMTPQATSVSVSPDEINIEGYVDEEEPGNYFFSICTSANDGTVRNISWEVYLKETEPEPEPEPEPVKKDNYVENKTAYLFGANAETAGTTSVKVTKDELIGDVDPETIESIDFTSDKAFMVGYSNKEGQDVAPNIPGSTSYTLDFADIDLDNHASASVMLAALLKEDENAEVSWTINLKEEPTPEPEIIEANATVGFATNNWQGQDWSTTAQIYNGENVISFKPVFTEDEETGEPLPDTGISVFVIDITDVYEELADLELEVTAIKLNGVDLTYAVGSTDPIDFSKIQYGDPEDKNNWRIEIYNKYGSTTTKEKYDAEVSPFDPSGIEFKDGDTISVYFTAKSDKLPTLDVPADGYDVAFDVFGDTDLSAVVDEEITAKLTDSEGNPVEAAVDGGKITATLKVGEYTLTVGGGNYVERSVPVIINQDGSADVEKVYVLKTGDVTGDGKIDTKDAMRVIAAAKKTTLIKDEYLAKVADVSGDGEVKTDDALKIIRAAKKEINLWK